MNYFLLDIKKFDKKRELINARKHRKCIYGIPKLGKKIRSGDILNVNFWAKTYYYHFEGICLSIKKKTLIKPNLTLKLRNVLFGIGIEMCMSYYNNRLFRNTVLLDYKRKSFTYKSSKIYYLKNRVNQATRV